MQNNNSQTPQERFTRGKPFRDRKGCCSSFQELEQGCNEWVREIRSILQIQNPDDISTFQERSISEGGSIPLIE